MTRVQNYNLQVYSIDCSTVIAPTVIYHNIKCLAIQGKDIFIYTLQICLVRTFVIFLQSSYLPLCFPNLVFPCGKLFICSLDGRWTSSRLTILHCFPTTGPEIHEIWHCAWFYFMKKKLIFWWWQEVNFTKYDVLRLFPNHI